MGPLRLISLRGIGVPGELCPGAPFGSTIVLGRGSVARNTSSLVNGLWGNRSPGVVTKTRKIV